MYSILRREFKYSHSNILQHRKYVRIICIKHILSTYFEFFNVDFSFFMNLLKCIYKTNCETHIAHLSALTVLVSTKIAIHFRR